MAASWCTDTAASMALLAVVWRALPQGGAYEASREYRAFIDFYPMTRSEWDRIIQEGFGPQPPALPALLARFDWLIDHYSCKWMEDVLPDPTWRALVRQQGGTPDHKRTGSPQTIFASPKALHKILESAKADFSAVGRDRIIVFGGADDFLSSSFGRSEQERSATLASLRKYFKAVFYEAKDVELEGMGTMPIGLLEMYARRGRAGALAAAAAAARTDEAAKDRQVLAAFGLLGFRRGSPPRFPDAAVRARHARGLRSRLAALDWARGAAGRAAGAVAPRRLGPEAFFAALARSRFALSPLGAGLQSPKTVEALLLLAVPIVPRAPATEDVRRLGFPLVLVRAWGEVRPSRLRRWWRELAPRLPRFRGRCLTTEAYWRMLTGQLPRCL